jgi:formamidopyrimidine-DNA glycosylase
LAARLRARKGRPVKAALLDQTCIAGLGSIYADEALHRARLHPLTRSGALTAEHVARLHQAIRDVLEVAVPVGGAIVKAGRAVPERESGRDFLRAHGRAGLPCLDCPPTDQAGGAPDAARGPAGDAVGRGRIARAVIAGRGTYFCPVCQPPPA